MLIDENDVDTGLTEKQLELLLEDEEDIEPDPVFETLTQALKVKDIITIEDIKEPYLREIF